MADASLTSPHVVSFACGQIPSFDEVTTRKIKITFSKSRLSIYLSILSYLILSYPILSIYLSIYLIYLSIMIIKYIYILYYILYIIYIIAKSSNQIGHGHSSKLQSPSGPGRACTQTPRCSSVCSCSVAHAAQPWGNGGVSQQKLGVLMVIYRINGHFRYLNWRYCTRCYRNSRFIPWNLAFT